MLLLLNKLIIYIGKLQYSYGSGAIDNNGKIDYSYSPALTNSNQLMKTTEADKT